MHFLLNYAEPCEKFVDDNKAQQKKIVIFYIEIKNMGLEKSSYLAIIYGLKMMGKN